jgi:hypothetical protein
MEKIKNKYSRYGVSEWVTLIIGVVIALIQIARYGLNMLGETSIELIVLALWALLITAPLTIANIIRKARGLETK